jgi:hypothetical protein
VKKAFVRVPGWFAIQKEAGDGGLMRSHCKKSKTNVFASMA